ncbi:hypothetical protein RFI_03494, partial [Reticulomyxa filosa]
MFNITRQRVANGVVVSGSVIKDMSKCNCTLRLNTHCNQLSANAWKVIVCVFPSHHDSKAVALDSYFCGHGRNSFVSFATRLYDCNKDSSYGEKFDKDGNIIVVHLDLINYQLSYTINGKKYGVAYDNLTKNVGYRLAVGLTEANWELELLWCCNF